MVIIDTDDALLIYRKDREQVVRAYVHQLEANGRARHLQTVVTRQANPSPCF